MRDVAAVVALRASVASVLSLCVRRESVDSLMPRRQEMRNADCGMCNVVRVGSGELRAQGTSGTRSGKPMEWLHLGQFRKRQSTASLTICRRL
jgi:hypothetical protein